MINMDRTIWVKDNAGRSYELPICSILGRPTSPSKTEALRRTIIQLIMDTDDLTKITLARMVLNADDEKLAQLKLFLGWDE